MAVSPVMRVDAAAAIAVQIARQFMRSVAVPDRPGQARCPRRMPGVRRCPPAGVRRPPAASCSGALSAAARRQASSPAGAPAGGSELSSPGRHRPSSRITWMGSGDVRHHGSGAPTGSRQGAPRSSTAWLRRHRPRPTAAADATLPPRSRSRTGAMSPVSSGWTGPRACASTRSASLDRSLRNDGRRTQNADGYALQHPALHCQARPEQPR